MSRSRRIVIAAIAVIAVGIGGFIAYDQVLRGDSASALTLPTATTDPASRSAPGASNASGASAAPAAGLVGGVAGTWNVAADSVAGYRVREQLASLPAESDAVGRTSAVTGSITLQTSGSTTTVTAGQITVDTTSITSDKSQRDGRLRTEGLQTDTYPTATFKLTKAFEVPAAALAGTASDVTLTGELTLHGVTKSVDIPAKAQLVNGTIQVAGSITFPLSDYSIVAPNLGGIIVSIADNGTLEFLVNFSKA
jgi:polyisoprenoid-binding protein YceI